MSFQRVWIDQSLGLWAQVEVISHEEAHVRHVAKALENGQVQEIPLGILDKELVSALEAEGIERAQLEQGWEAMADPEVERTVIEWEPWTTISEDVPIPVGGDDGGVGTLIQVELRNGKRRLMAELNLACGTCGCCCAAEGYWLWNHDDPQPTEIVRFRVGKLLCEEVKRG